MSTKLLPAFLLLCYSCGQPPAPAGTIQGAWESIGYGRIINFTADSFQLYDVTKISCFPINEGRISEYEGHSSLVGDKLTLESGYSKYRYTRTDQIPERCRQPLTKTKREDPVFNFDVLVATIAENYAYFELNDLNWDSLKARARSKISPATTPPELYLVMKQLFEDLKDNHGGIYPPDEVADLAEAMIVNESVEDELPTYGDFQIADMVVDHHLDEPMTKDSWLVKWGTMRDSIGYVQVKAMWLFADLDLSKELIAHNGLVDTYNDALSKLSEADQITAEAKGMARIMDRVMADLMETSAIIIDVRFNGGGQDLVGLEILKRFNEKRRRVATKKAVDADGYTKTYPLFLEASPTPYLKPVFLLTSQQSASATDFMALCSGELPHLNRIGSRTCGAVSDALPKQLPNGWFFSLSNEVYQDNRGRCYENIGVPVDNELYYPADRQTFFRGVASGLDDDKRQILAAVAAYR